MDTNIPVIYILIIAAVFISGAVISFLGMQSNKKRTTAYLNEHPDAVKVYLKSTNYLVASSHVTVAQVDGLAPAAFMGGIYVKPGKSVLLVAYSASRVGFFYRRVNSGTDYVPIEVDLESGKEYLLSYSKKEGFQINEK